MNITNYLYEFAEINPGKPAFLHPVQLSFWKLIETLEDMQVDAFARIPRAHLLRYLSPSAFKYVRIWISTGFTWFGKGFSLKRMKYDECQT